MVVDKSALFFRDEEGNLLPLEVHSDLIKGTVMLRPLTLGTLAKRGAAKDDGNQDMNLLLDHLIEPKITKEEYTKIPEFVKKELLILLLMTLGLERDDAEEAYAKGNKIVQEALKKKSMTGKRKSDKVKPKSSTASFTSKATTPLQSPA